MSMRILTQDGLALYDKQIKEYIDGKQTTYITYTNKVDVIGNDTRYVAIGISQYNADTDTLKVYLNGVRLIEWEAYILNKADKTIFLADNTNWEDGDQLLFEVSKSSYVGNISDVATKEELNELKEEINNIQSSTLTERQW